MYCNWNSEHVPTKLDIRYNNLEVLGLQIHTGSYSTSEQFNLKLLVA